MDVKKVLVWVLVLVVGSLGLVACLPSQAGDQPATAEPAVTPVQDTEPEPAAEATPPATAGEDLYSEATDSEDAAPGGETDSVSDVLGEGKPVIVYGRSGGIAGIMETYEIYPDGRVVFAEKGGVTELWVPADEVKAMLALLDELDLAGLAKAAPPSLGGLGADRFTYTLTVIQDGKPVQLTMVEGQSDLSAGLQEAMSAVQALIGAAKE